MSRLIQCLTLIAFWVLLSGCGTFRAITVKPDDKRFAPPPEDQFIIPEKRVSGGGLYQQGYNWSLIADRRAYRVGDILTVELNESTQSSKQAKTNFGKETNVDIGISKLFDIKNVAKVDESISAQRGFSGNAVSQQQNMLRGAITVAVHQVLPNGVLVIRGEKWLTLNQGDEYIRLTGLIRAEDIQRDNTVSSQRIANARIAYSGRGALNEANMAGWLTRFFNHPLFPL